MKGYVWHVRRGTLHSGYYAEVPRRVEVIMRKLWLAIDPVWGAFGTGIMVGVIVTLCTVSWLRWL